ncbi:hypothetical protein FJY69_00670 [candidate division WOR-3 bacterium]|nr:hypothetical protein [candidate division WOR-3 bacterium]
MPLVRRRGVARLRIGQFGICFLAFCILAVPPLVLATHHHEDGEEHHDCYSCDYASAPASPAPLILPPQPEGTWTPDTPGAFPAIDCVDAGRSPDAPRAPPVLLNT